MDNNLFTYVTPEKVQETYSSMREIVNQLQNAQMSKTQLATKLATCKAEMARSPDFKWGANDTVRDAQVAMAYPELVSEIAEARLAEQALLDRKELIQLYIQMYQMIINLFEAARPIVMAVTNVSGK